MEYHDVKQDNEWKIVQVNLIKRRTSMDNLFRNELKKYEGYEGLIWLVCKKFKNAITYFDVINWLENFKPEEYDAALNILKNFTFFGDLDIIEAFNDEFTNILEDLNEKSDIYIISVGKYGKSGSAMIYFLNKTDAYKNKMLIKGSCGDILNHQFKIITNTEELVNEVNDDSGNNKVVVMIDDFFGTGNSVIDFYYGRTSVKRKVSLINLHEEFNKLSRYPQVKFLSVAAMSRAVENIKKEIPRSDLYCKYIFNRAFEINGSPFGYRPKMRSVRQLCYSYGEGLYKQGPLGYKNTQSLIAFSYGAPNNTLPIIWAEKQNWYPIYPRFYKHKMEKAKKFRKETAFYLSFAQSIGVKNIDKFLSGRRNLGWKKITFVQKTDFLTFGLLRLLRKRKSRIVICQLLGISLSEYEEIINGAKQKGMLNNQGDLTKVGDMLYFEVVKEIKKIKKTSKVDREKQPIVYLPDSFEGKT
ncbi:MULTISPECIES: hypothetical protein [Bacillus]|uniref:phosphoribosyltransferase-like protein n=1 Tax=Bacillus TaxID=1386 RepID=UPI00027950CB|nr:MULTISPECIES: hypothetical protein [Bacillus]EJQ85322.1 hypothetical protein IGK_00206 [Bacillus toyonensis]MDA1877399.1 hypothetical protein [Bacillus cereus group sp. BY112LC]QEQ16011.1 hypothetical protein F0362_04910 [Bacillus sp. BS98]QWG96429.1 hypothetical protein EXW33_17645 [Bacillus toyonensis]